MDAKVQEEILQVAAALPKRIREFLLSLPDSLLNSLTELRLRSNGPMLLVTPDRSCYITVSGKRTYMQTEHLFCATQNEISDVVSHACGYSAHSHQEAFANGYLTIRGGHRIGLCGTAVTENGSVIGIRDVLALNIRIAREIPNAAQETLRIAYQSGLKSILLAGAPMSGKTTILRALAKSLADGYTGKLVKCAVIDERGELFPENTFAQTQNCNIDILSGYSKRDGIALAVRALSPDMIFCDEIGSAEDVRAIAEGIRCGVRFVATAHADCIADLYARQKLKPLFKDKLFDNILLLGTGENIGKVRQIVKAGESYAENCGTSADSGLLRMDGGIFVREGA